MSDQAEDRTESATPQSIQRAHEQGEYPISPEINTLGMFVAFTVSLFIVLPNIVSSFLAVIRRILSVRVENAYIQNLEFAFDTFSLLALFLLPITALSLFTQLAQSQFNIRFKGISIDFSNLNPIKRIGNIFSSMHIEFFKSVMKLFVISAVVIGLLYISIFQSLEQYIGISMPKLFQAVYYYAILIIGVVLFPIAFISLLDYIHKSYKFDESMRMTPYDIKRELKDSTINQEVKQKMRSLHQKHMQGVSKQVQDSTFVLMNPTHYAVCIKYDIETMDAPIIVSKGQGDIALLIKDIAILNSIPVVRNPTTARALYNNVPIGGELPEKYYMVIIDIMIKVLGMYK